MNPKNPHPNTPPNPTPSRPPKTLLTALLPPHHRETIPGDLLEERLHRAQTSGPLRAHLWYLRQVLSFVPHALTDAFTQAPTLACLCAFTALCGSWLGFMDIRLHHPNLPTHELIAGTIVLQARLTQAALVVRLPTLRALALLGTAAISTLAARALWSTLHSRDTEGYILLIALALLLQTTLTWITLRRRHQTRQT